MDKERKKDFLVSIYVGRQNSRAPWPVIMYIVFSCDLIYFDKEE